MNKEQEKYAAEGHFHWLLLTAVVLGMVGSSVIGIAFEIAGIQTIDQKQQARIESLEATVTAIQPPRNDCLNPDTLTFDRCLVTATPARQERHPTQNDCWYPGTHAFTPCFVTATPAATTGNAGGSDNVRVNEWWQSSDFDLNPACQFRDGYIQCSGCCYAMPGMDDATIDRWMRALSIRATATATVQEQSK